MPTAPPPSTLVDALVCLLIYIGEEKSVGKFPRDDKQNEAALFVPFSYNHLRQSFLFFVFANPLQRSWFNDSRERQVDKSLHTSRVCARLYGASKQAGNAIDYRFLTHHVPHGEVNESKLREWKMMKILEKKKNK